MAVSPDTLPPKKKREFIGTDERLLRSLLVRSRETCSLNPIPFVLYRNSNSIIRKTKLLTLLLEDLVVDRDVRSFPASAVLCFEELFILLHNVKTLIEDCKSTSKLWLLIQQQTVANKFYELTLELSTLIDIFPVKEMNLCLDVEETVNLIRKQCSKTDATVDERDINLKHDVLHKLDNIKREIVPQQSKLKEIFTRLQLNDSISCTDEIQILEEEVRNQEDEKSKADIVSLIGLVRYAKCVLYGESSPRIVRRRKFSSSADLTIPADFRCPISLDLMRDPVVVSTGQTYDRASITLWIESGHTTCPKTGQTLAHTETIPNLALRNLIVMWCREHRIPFESTEVKENVNGVTTNKTLIEATKMTVSFLLQKAKASQSLEMANRFVSELRALAKTDSNSRACIAEADGLPLLVKFLGSEHPNLQVNAVTTILNLSILEANKIKIMETDGVLNGVIEVLRTGATWEAKGNAAATIFSLTGVHAYRKKLGRKTRVIKGLMELAKNGPIGSKRDALVAILNLAGDRETVGKLLEVGVVEMASEVMDGLPEEGVTVLEAVVKKGGMAAITASFNVIRKLAMILRDGTERAQESAAATLVNICRKGGLEIVSELAAIPGIERVIWEVMGMGTGRGRRKAATLLRILRRWAAGLYGSPTAAYAAASASSTTATAVVLPG
ncbi:putative U box domain, Zinc finger, RING/FYVE/PHD-type [Helianthus annuus]|uniref:RING-type E3 ubiquitin transferase n=1 Tax=Helianthus annuus TaxID=4232 RepID=A0A251S4I4_HELAN|nr:U-box domain-containing protein 16 [Helianthus annuus]KAF5782853.1 putative U box domain, Zinc finger, RING/FYVE/PHD-type [Helianthus annuus]KAJ0510332.1 putative U box domain, Zinc finger, RING/FYVE/PHD-type [Helianthus annuus]KAJ0875962.1 putative U box domain, Zinc finger, RING/FYVE/PHD-type [Helianthus annuus]